MKLGVLVNPMSGSVPEDAESLLRAAAEEAGVVVDVTLADAHQLKDAVAACAAAKCDVLGVWGGDGTIACALETLGPAGVPVLPLPGGTMNLLHRKVHSIADGATIDWQDCFSRALTGGKIVEISAGCLNDERRFYVGALFGELAGLSRAREAIREGKPMEAAEKATEVGAFDLETRLAFHEIRGEETGMEGKATALAAFVPEDGAENLEIGWINPDNLAQLAGLGFEIALGDWRSASGVEYHRWPSLRIFHTHEDKIEATLDGEPLKVPTASLIRVIKDAARVWAAPGT